MEAANLASRDYYAVKALSNSGIKQILKSPAHFKLWESEQKKPTDAMRVGTALHSYVLDGVRSFPIYTGSTKTLNSKEGDAFLKLHPNGLTRDEHDQVVRMGESLLANVKLRGLIENSDREVAIYGSEETEHGEVPTKALLDIVAPRAILDIKTTSDFATDFKWNARKYGYDIQAAWYRHMAYQHFAGPVKEFFFVVVESKPPYGVMLYQAGEETVNAALDRCMDAVQIYGKCLATGEWPCYSLDSIPVL